MTAAGPALDIRQSLIPFTVRLLRYGPDRSHRPVLAPLELGARSRWYRDDFIDMAEVLGQGVWFATCQHAAGWYSREMLLGEATMHASPGQARVWEASDEVALEFTDASLQVVESLFNLAIRPPRGMLTDIKAVRSEAAAHLGESRLEGSGDVLASYWLLCGLWPELPVTELTPGGPDKPVVAGLGRLMSRHPLLALRYAIEVTGVSLQADALETLFASPLRPLLPWLVEHALANWSVAEDRLWDGSPERFIAARKQQTAVLQCWLGAIAETGWYDVAEPIAAWARAALKALASTRPPVQDGEDPPDLESMDPGERAIRRVDVAFWGARQEERFAVRQAWAGVFATVLALLEIRRQVTRFHPVDRDPHHEWFVAWWSRAGLDELMDELETVSRAIEGRLG